MSTYAQMMKKKGPMAKKEKKETPTQNLEHELLTDHGTQSLGAPQKTATGAASVAPLEAQAAKKRKLVLWARQASPAPTSQGLETIHPGPQNEISISNDDEEETVGLALKRKRG
jgi:anti-sigma-K factor RskA